MQQNCTTQPNFDHLSPATRKHLQAIAYQINAAANAAAGRELIEVLDPEYFSRERAESVPERRRNAMELRIEGANIRCDSTTVYDDAAAILRDYAARLVNAAKSIDALPQLAMESAP